MIVDWVFVLLALIIVIMAFVGWEVFKVQIAFDAHHDLVVEIADKHNMLAKQVQELAEQMSEAIDELYEELDEIADDTT